MPVWVRGNGNCQVKGSGALATAYELVYRKKRRISENNRMSYIGIAGEIRAIYMAFYVLHIYI
jgi:hypothetical protein